MPEPKKALYPELIVRNKQPQNFLEEDLSLFQAALSEKIPASHYRHLQNALLLKDTVFRGFKFWQEYSQITPLNSKSKLKRLLLGLFKKNKIEKGIWITDNWSNAYFHWLTDSMSRLIAIDPLISGHKVLLPKNYKDFGYIKESLDLLNYQYQFLEDKAPYLVHDLLLPSHIAPTGNFQPDVINKVREKFLSVHNLKKPFRKIFISREKAKARKLINEDQFSSQLKNLGFEIHMFEEYSLAEQIKLMAECSFLAGLHGAGLTNMLFMQKGTTVIELRKSDDDLNNCYFSMASALELNYYYIKCKTDHTITQRANFEIPEEGINNFINIFSEDFSETQRKS